MSEHTAAFGPTRLRHHEYEGERRVDLPAYGAEGIQATVDAALGFNLATVLRANIYSRAGETRLSFDGTFAGLSTSQGAIGTARVEHMLEFAFGRTEMHRAFGTDVRMIIDGRSFDTRLYFTACRIHRRGLVLGDADLLSNLHWQAS